jgi:secreted trypsin-like serine protease
MAITKIIKTNNPILMPSYGGWRRLLLLLLLWLATMATAAVTTTVVAAGHDDSAPVVWGDDGRRRRRRVSSSSSSSKRRLQARIVGGKPVVAAAHSFVPSFAFPAGTKLCGATVIHPDVLLSAAHCAGAFVEDGVLIGGVELRGMDAMEFVGVVAELSHPLYQPGGSEQNDIMLVKLDRSVRDTASLVQYNVNASVPNEPNVLQVVGYGRTSTNGPNAATLQQVEVGIVANNECVAALRARNLFVDPATMLCTSTR